MGGTRYCGLVSAIAFAIGAFAQGDRPKRAVPVSPDQVSAFQRYQKYAIVVGIGDYPEGSGLSALHYAKSDANAIADVLEKQGFAVRPLYDAKASRSLISQALRDAADLSDPGGTLLFYFSGHGFRAGDDNYLATYGASAMDLSRDGLSLREVRQILQKAAAKRKVVFLDACRSEGGKGGTARTFEGLDKSSGTRMLLSTQSGRISWESDDLRHGVFTYFLLKGLTGGAAGDDGRVTFRDLADYVAAEVRTYSFKSGRMQLPVELSDEAVGDFLLVGTKVEPGAPALPPEKAPETAAPVDTRAAIAPRPAAAESGESRGRAGGGSIGIRMQDVNGRIQIAEVIKDGPAWRAGLEPGDVLIDINKQRVQGSAHLLALIAQLRPGETVKLGVERNGVAYSADVLAGDREAIFGVDDLIEKARAAYRSSNNAEGERLMQQALARDPNRPEPYATLGVDQYYGSNPAQGAQYLTKAVQLGGWAVVRIHHHHVGDVGNASSYCVGNLWISREGVRFEGGIANESFAAGRHEIVEAEINKLVGAGLGMFHLKIAGANGKARTFNFVGLLPLSANESSFLLSLIRAN
jgi:hypothetical protein